MLEGQMSGMFVFEAQTFLFSHDATFVVVVGVGVGVGVGVVTNRVPTQNLRTVVGIDLLFFLIDWYE